MLPILIRSVRAFGVLCALVVGMSSASAEDLAKILMQLESDAKSKPDTRPKNSRLVDHGSFSAKDISVNRLQWMTPDGKYCLDLKDIDVVQGETHRYKISGLPPRLILHLGFAVRSKSRLIAELPVGELQQATGLRRIHIHLATAEGHVLLSEEFNLKDSFRYTLPNNGRYPGGFNGIVSEGSHTDWKFGPNTASGAAFVLKVDTSYVLEITVIEADEKIEKRQPLRPLIRS